MRYLAAAAAVLSSGCLCQCFVPHLPAPPSRMPPQPSSLNQRRSRVQPLRVLTSPDETQEAKVKKVDDQTQETQVMKVDEQVQGSKDMSLDVEHGREETAGAVAPYTPKFLWWTESSEEENKTLNLAANAGFLAGVLLLTIFAVITVDSDVSRGWTASEIFLRVPLDNWLGYTEMLRDNPVLVKACTSGSVYALGDWVAQAFEGTELSDIKRGRVLRSALAGLLLHGPLSHVWYDVCETLFDTIGWNDYWWVAAPKVVTDQLLWGPLWNAIYIWITGTLKRDSFETIKDAITSTAVPLIVSGLKLWPLAHLVTYGLIPKENRLLWVDAVEIVWVTILSKQAAAKAAEQAEQAEQAGQAAELEGDSTK